tara:strand:+ start:162 stop:779 length:618 start_codon:yes stop_codon:yes gene_type:complete
MAKVKWTAVRDQSLALAAREAGFNLTMFEEYPEATQQELRKQAIKIALRNIEWEYEEETGKDLCDVRQGVYVISISQPFTIAYDGGCSEIIYIGIGNIFGRIKSHFNNSLFDFMMSVAGANFDFHFTDPKYKTGPDYYKHIEYMLLEKFAEKKGGGQYPLLNTNAGSNRGYEEMTKGWDQPLVGYRRRAIWQIKPTKHWEFAKLD